jgi:hypothetical protein
MSRVGVRGVLRLMREIFMVCLSCSLEAVSCLLVDQTAKFDAGKSMSCC